MDTRKEKVEPGTDTGADAAEKPLKVNKDSLKDLTPQSRTTEDVKGGIPKQPDSRDF